MATILCILHISHTSPVFLLIPEVWQLHLYSPCPHYILINKTFTLTRYSNLGFHKMQNFFSTSANISFLRTIFLHEEQFSAMKYNTVSVSTLVTLAHNTYTGCYGTWQVTYLCCQTAVSRGLLKKVQIPPPLKKLPLVSEDEVH